MNDKIKEAMYTALRAFENYKKDNYQFYGETKNMAIKQLTDCLEKYS